MKMFLGSGPITNYALYTPDCALKQYPFKVPVLSLSDVQLYIDGAMAGAAQLLHTCGPSAGTIDSVSYNGGGASDYHGNPYSVMNNFSGSSPTNNFVIAVTAGGATYFSPEYQIVQTNCGNPPVWIQGCYGNLDPSIAWDCNGKYLRGPVPWEHKMLLRGVEVVFSGIKNNFKQGRTRNFRTEKEKIYEFYAEFIPEWYLEELDAIFHRGEVNINGVKYLVDNTAYEKIEECLKVWKPSVTLHRLCMQSFSCEADPCTVTPIVPGGGGSGGTGSGGGGSTTPTVCCDVTVNTATRTIV